jgi:hypothetical protein
MIAMFNDNTLFILGAGASTPYGYPLGNELITNIIDSINNDYIYIPMSSTSIQKYINNANSIIELNFQIDEIIFDLKNTPLNTFATEGKQTLNSLMSFKDKTYAAGTLDKITEFRELRKALIEYDPISIDAFLNQNPRYAVAGKIMIIYALLKCENKDLFERRRETTDYRPDNWYSYLIKDLLSGSSNPSVIKNNNLNIITFNYDMSLDYCLAKKLSEVGILSDNDVAKNFIYELTTKRIHHVYGQLHNEIPIKNYGDHFVIKNGAFTEKNRNGNMARLIASIKTQNSIRLIGEERKHHTTDYKQLIKDAKKIIIIGFGFDRDNLDILGFPNEETEYAQLLMGKQLKYMDYKGTMRGLADQFDYLKLRHGALSLSITRSKAELIKDAYQNDFKIYLYQ